MSARFLSLLLSALVIGPPLMAQAVAVDRVAVQIGKDAPTLEQFAASELATQFKRLFDVEAFVAKAPQEADVLVLLGSPTTNSAIPANKWPEVSDQGIVCKSATVDGQQALIVGGGSPAATLWAVYELGHRLGVRYLLRDDIYPETPIAFELENLQVVMEPQLRTRTWRTIGATVVGPESWPLANHERLLHQLAKMKFNRLMLSVYPWHPFVHYECRGVEKRTATLFSGEEYPIARDAPGRTALDGAKSFENPDFADIHAYDSMITAGRKHLQGIITAANRLGMSVGLSLSPLEFPSEFAKLLPGAKSTSGINDLLIAPGAAQKFNDPILKELVSAKIRAYLDTYPQLDRLYLTMPEFTEWGEHAEEAWQVLARQIGNDAPKLATLLQQASGERRVQSLRGNIVALAFLHELLQDDRLLERPDGSRIEVVLQSLGSELFAYSDNILPEKVSTLNFANDTALGVVEQRQYLQQLPSGSRELSLTLADDRIGVLSQSNTRRLETLVNDILNQDWQGFATRNWMLAELDPAVHYLSLTSWDPNAMACSAHNDLFTQITGNKSVADRLWLAFGHIEAATELIDEHDPDFASPVEGMLMKHFQAEPVPQWWDDLNEQYKQAMIELYRSHDAAHPRSRSLLFYWAKRSEYVLEYLSAVRSLREAAIARAAGDQEIAIEHLEAAQEQLYNAIDTLSDVAHDQSDRGLIAVLNAYAYQPLLLEYEAMLSEE